MKYKAGDVAIRKFTGWIPQMYLFLLDEKTKGRE